MVFTRDQIIEWLSQTGKVIEANRDYLTQLDADIGDADHGINLDRGFKKVTGQLSSLAGKDIGDIFKGVGMALISSVGGASGPLYGTLFLRAGNISSGKFELTSAELGEVLKAGLSGVIERGRAQLGEKTMVDALSPAVNAYLNAVRNGAEMDSALKQALESAEKGLQDTVPMLAKKGRASYLGERSIGHQDPGSTSTCLILKTLYSVVSKEG
jgi:dihydroxyacetone kinase-like protein